MRRCEADALRRLRDDLYARIVDLDFDREVGKTDEEGYHRERADLRREALAALRRLDERSTATAITAAEKEAIERAIRAARDRTPGYRRRDAVDRPGRAPPRL